MDGIVLGKIGTESVDGVVTEPEIVEGEISDDEIIVNMQADDILTGELHEQESVEVELTEEDLEGDMAHAYAAPPTKAEIEEVVEEYFEENPVKGVSEYPELNNKPSINDVELKGNKTAAELGLAMSSEIPDVPAWSMQQTKPTYTATEVGADAAGAAAEALAAANSHTETQITAHNVATDAHNDLRIFIAELTQRVNALADSDDTTLDQMSEIVAYIKNNRELVEQVTTEKVSVTDIIDNLTTNLSNKALAASMGVYLKQLIDAIKIPTKVSELQNDAGYITDVYELKWEHNWTGLPLKASWTITLYKNGVVCEDNAYAEILYATNLSAEAVSLSGYTGTFTGTKTWTSTSGAKYIASVYADDSKAKLLCVEELNPTHFDSNRLLDFLYPVGSVYMTSENKAPAIGGEWELVGKGFKEAQGNATTGLFTPDSTNTTSCTVYYRRSGNTMWVKFVLKNKVALTDSTIALGTLNLAALGVTAFAHQTMHQMPFGSENGIALCNVTTAGALSSVDVNPKTSTATSIAAESTFYGQYTLTYMAAQMLDSFCDKFYWKRTA